MSSIAGALAVEPDREAKLSARTALSADAPVSPLRYFGNVPLEVRPDTFELSFSRQEATSDSNLLALHFDFFGIPWQRFARDARLPRAWKRKIREASDLKASGLPVYLGLTPIALSRDRLAPNVRGHRRLKLDDQYSGRCEFPADPLDRRTLRDAYNAYVSYMVERFDPMFVALSIEVNLYAVACPQQWQHMKEMLNDVYAEQKSRRPDLVLFHTFHVDTLWEATTPEQTCFGFRTHCLERNLVALSDLRTDIFALSTYPLPALLANNGVLPDNWLTIFAERVDVPIAISETGFQASSLSIESDGGGCIEAFESSPTTQAWWMHRVLTDANRISMPFVVWWANKDLMPHHLATPCTCEADDGWCTVLDLLGNSDRFLFRFFSVTGLRDYDGTGRPALDLWTAAMRSAS